MRTISCWETETEATEARRLAKPTPSEIWEEMKGKARFYKTAMLADGRFVRILGVVCDGTFEIHHPTFGPMHVGCQELTRYCL